jgi:hypothetical protein
MHSEDFTRGILRAIDKYNMYRGKEANARLIFANKSKIIVELTGSFCYSCGFYDWIDDLRYEFMDELNLDIKIASIDEVKLGVYNVVYILG